MRNSFVFFEEFGQQIDCLDDDRQLAFYRAIKEYAFTGNEPLFKGAELALWKSIKSRMDFANDKFEKKVKNLRQNKNDKKSSVQNFSDTENRISDTEKQISDTEKQISDTENKKSDTENRISEGETETETETEYETENIPPISPEGETESGYSRAFESFWAVYPKKVGKGAAAKSFQKSFAGIKSGQDRNRLRARMIEQVLVQMDTEQWKKNGGQFIPNPATWLNQRRWEDGTGPGGTESELRAAGWTDADIAAGFKCS